MSTLTESPPVVFNRVEASPSQWKISTIIGLVLIVAAYTPLLIAHGMVLWSKPHYQFFPLVLIGAGLLVYNNRHRLGQLQPGKYQILAYAGASFSIIVLAFGTLINSPLLGTVAFLFGLLAFLYSWGGWVLLSRMLPAWIFLWLAVPPPRNLDQVLINNLQTITARWSSKFLDLFGVVHSMSGNVVDVPGRRLMVEEACSGINSLFAILTCSLFFVFWSRRGIIHSILLLLGGFGWVLVGNIARVLVIALAFTKRGIDLTEGFRHDALGFVIFIVMVGLVWSLDRLLLFIIGTITAILLWRRESMRRRLEEKLDKARPRDMGKTRWPELSVTWIRSIPIMACFLLLAGVNGMLFAKGMFELPPLNADRLIGTFAQINENFLPSRIDRWEMQGFKTDQRKAGDINGDYSRTWYYKMGDFVVVISLDYAWTTYHDLRICYNATGWSIRDDQTLINPIPGREVPDHIHVVKWSKPLGMNAFLLFTNFNADGMPLELPEKNLFNKEDILKRLKRFSFERQPKPLVYQVQLFTQSIEPLSPEQEQAALRLFQEVRQRFSQVAPYREGR